ncbi:OsmC family peroxiredoxin [Intrasporangium flavum]|uniref:OsmC family peroxiredoxin n=1 Tax=Intrasporangium flavum TaxID=1428657 RepID=UPI00096EBED0|nr:OsmC family peroxiredoxin [Intrasporangium flavum]
MATIRNASAHWEGSLMEGAGQVTFESSNLGTHEVTWASRAEEPGGRTSPEELIAAAHSTCFSMALSHGLAQAGTPPESIDTQAAVTFQPGTGITGIVLTVTGKVPGLTAAQFEEAAQAAKEGCPVSQALKAVPISLEVSFTE